MLKDTFTNYIIVSGRAAGPLHICLCYNNLLTFDL